MPDREHTLDHDRRARIGLDEAVFCAGKSPEQIAAIVEEVAARGASLLLTRLDGASFEALPPGVRAGLDFDPVSATGFFGSVATPTGRPRAGVVTAGTSDVPVAREAVRTLAYHGEPCVEVHDVGVAGTLIVLGETPRGQQPPALGVLWPAIDRAHEEVGD